jgi:hypothetical protein
MFSRAVVDCVSPAQTDLAGPDAEHNRHIPAPISGLASAIYCADDLECRGTTRHLEKVARTGDYRDDAASSGNTWPNGDTVRISDRGVPVLRLNAADYVQWLVCLDGAERGKRRFRILR